MDLKVCSPVSLDIDLTKKDTCEDSDEEEEESDDDSSDGGYDETAFRVVADGRAYTFLCATSEQKNAWMQAFEMAIVGAQLRLDPDKDKDIGWRHRIVRTSLYAAAVCNDAEMLQSVSWCQLLRVGASEA